MARYAATGQVRPLANGRFAARIRIDDAGTRRSFPLVGVAQGDEAAARTRCEAMAEMAERVRAAGFDDKLVDLLKMAARARAGRPWEAILSATEKLCTAHGLRRVETGAVVTTVKALGAQWQSNELHERHPDSVKKKKHAWRDEILARKYVDPVIGHLNIAEVTLADCDEVMAHIAARHEAHERAKATERARKRKEAGLPAAPRAKITEPSPATRRHVAQYVRRLLEMAVHPCGLRDANPIPRLWLPQLRKEHAKAKECLYPDEDRKLLACTLIPVVRRLAYGFLCREGMRTDELARLTWRDVDLERGRVDLDENKTGDPRAWAMDPGVVRALEVWKEIAPKRKRRGAAARAGRIVDDRVFPLDVDHLAERLRADLKLAGVEREKLFERSATRMPLRAHDLRATFVTNALATPGRTETWVADRTGHKSSAMINRYRRKARAWFEMELGALDPLVHAIPELRELAEADGAEAAARATDGVPFTAGPPSRAGGQEAGGGEAAPALARGTRRPQAAAATREGDRQASTGAELAARGAGPTDAARAPAAPAAPLGPNWAWPVTSRPISFDFVSGRATPGGLVRVGDPQDPAVLLGSSWLTEVRRRGVEPLRELPHWNLKPSPGPGETAAAADSQREDFASEAADPAQRAGLLGPDVGPNGGPKGAAPSSRGVAIADLYRHASALAAGGDLEAARAIHGTIGRLLGDAGAAPGGKVLDLHAERKGGRT
jgi:integrase